MLGGRRDVGGDGWPSSLLALLSPTLGSALCAELPSPSQMEEAPGHGGLLPEHHAAPGPPAVLYPPHTPSARPALRHAAGCGPGRDPVRFPWADPNAELSPAPATFLI